MTDDQLIIDNWQRGGCIICALPRGESVYGHSSCGETVEASEWYRRTCLIGDPRPFFTLKRRRGLHEAMNDPCDDIFKDLPPLKTIKLGRICRCCPETPGVFECAVDCTCDCHGLYKCLDEKKAELKWITAERERLVHGKAVEGDYVCPDSYPRLQAEKEAEHWLTQCRRVTEDLQAERSKHALTKRLLEGAQDNAGHWLNKYDRATIELEKTQNIAMGSAWYAGQLEEEIKRRVEADNRLVGTLNGLYDELEETKKELAEVIEKWVPCG